MGQWTQMMKIERKRAGVMRKLTQSKRAASTKPRWDDEHRKGMDDRKGKTHQIQNGGLHQNHAVKRPGGNHKNTGHKLKIASSHSPTLQKNKIEVVIGNKFENSRRINQLRHGMK
jgi:hypothetical protein